MENIQFGIVLEASASSLTHGLPGPGSEGSVPHWHHFN